MVSCIGVTVLGSLGGCLLLLTLPTEVFDTVIPALVALASVLLGLQRTGSCWPGRSTHWPPATRPSYSLDG